jgi:phosphoglycerate-specific signal transduction histidine kinase
MKAADAGADNRELERHVHGDIGTRNAMIDPKTDSAESDEAGRGVRLEHAEEERAQARLRELRSALRLPADPDTLAQAGRDFVHELNQPLAAATNFVNAARLRLAHEQGKAIDAAREDLEEAAVQLQRSARIINQLRKALMDSAAQSPAGSATGALPPQKE